MLSRIISIPFFVGLKRLLQGTDIFLFLTHRLVELVIQVERLVQPGNTGFCKKRALDSGTRFDLSFFLPYSFFTRKGTTYIIIDVGLTLSQSQNNKAFSDNFIMSLLRTLSQNHVVEGRRLSRFPTKMTLVHARALLSSSS